MRAAIAFLLLGYLLSQFYRAFLAVLAPMLTAELGATAEQLARASGLWFLAYAAAQLPVGWALDRIGPRRTAGALTALAAAGAAIFALAPAPWAITLAMTLIGIGCAPVLMAAYYLIARNFRPAAFATLAGAITGLGALGNLAAAWPLAWAAESFGWRASVAVLASLTLVTALAIWRAVADPPPAPAGAARGRLVDRLRLPALWAILALLLVQYAPSAGLRGLWIGPYLEEVHGADAAAIGEATLIMALAMVMGSVAYGPLDRLFGTRKRVVMAGSLAALACLLALWAAPDAGFWTVTLLLAGVGFFGAAFPLIVAHGRSFFPPELTGRGVTLMNLFAIGGVGLLQIASAQVHGAAAAASPGDPAAPYAALFGFFAVALALGCLAYAFSRDRKD